MTDAGDFNPRSPCGERLVIFVPTRQRILFQSTLPVWGATDGTSEKPPDTTDFNPRSPCGERPDIWRWPSAGRWISIHAPRVGSDYIPDFQAAKAAKFQSTLPVWGATEGLIVDVWVSRISIHAPRVGSDENVPARKVDEIISIHAPRVGSD